MGKSDDSIARRRNKRNRKKQNDKFDSSQKVSSRVASIIASKKRRLTGKRRICQGMCFSLPTIEDPFNDRKGKPEPLIKKKRKPQEHKKRRVQKDSHNNKSVCDSFEDQEALGSKNVENRALPYIGFIGPEIVVNLGKQTKQNFKLDESSRTWNISKSVIESSIECPSTLLAMCTDLTQRAVDSAGGLENERDNSTLSDRWGLDFWNCYSTGKDVLEIFMADSTAEQIAWIASAAACTISSKKKEAISFSTPFLLFLVPSQDRACKVRHVCKPLKASGIRSVSLHSGATIDHQINGLRSSEPAFLISTPERLLELLSLKAVDLSGVLLMAVEGLESPFSRSYIDSVESIRRSISRGARMIVFCDCKNISPSSALKEVTGISVCP